MVDKKVQDAKTKNKKKILKRKNVVGVGVGYKICQDIPTDRESVVVLVEKKVPSAQLKKKDAIPKEIDGIPTDVIEVGKIVAQDVDPTKKHRPAPGGVSIGHYAITAGTLGCVVKKNGVRYILSNNHVLANSNAANIGDPIYQPGPYDGGSSSDKIATLAQFIPIDMGGDVPPPPPDDDNGDSHCPIANLFAKVTNFFTRMIGSSYSVVLKKQSAPNYVDCALAKPLNDEDVLDSIDRVGLVTGVNSNPALALPVKKMGRTTVYTEDVIKAIGVTVNVDYGNGRVAEFEDQILAGAMSAGGDSGSLVLDEDNKAVGLLFAGSSVVTILNPIDYVINALGITF